MSFTVQDVLARVKDAKKAGTGWMARCPAHDDDKASLHINSGDNGKTLLKCFARCEYTAIVQALGITEQMRSEPTGPIIYSYTDESGAVLYESLRYEPKNFKQRKPDGKGGYTWKLGDVRRVPYNLPALRKAAEAGAVVYLVEGEKDVATLMTLGVIATTIAGGAQARLPDDFASHFIGAKGVVLLPDNDEPGHQYAARIATALSHAGLACKVVELPGLEPKGDVTDWVCNGGTLPQLMALVKAAPRFTPPPAQPSTEHISSGDVPETTKAMPQVSVARTLRDWIAAPEILRPPHVVIPHLAVEGRVTLFSGREKIGKSTLAGGAVASASHCGNVLGVEMVAPISTLWYAIDEPVADTVRRFERMGADLDRIIVNEAPRTHGELLAALSLDLEAFPGVRCVVVDTLSKILSASGVDPNSSREVDPVITRLADYFHSSQVAGVLLYHTGKGGREYRGSTSIGASVDEILTLRKRGAAADTDDFDADDSDDGRRLLVQDGRNLRGRLQLTCVDGAYTIFDTGKPPRERILAALADRQAIGRSELAKRAELRKATGLHAIAGLIADGSIRETGRKVELVPNNASSRFPTPGTEAPNGIAWEPDLALLDKGGSPRFPPVGTAPEPYTGTKANTQGESGSASGNHPLTETGTGSAGEPAVVDLGPMFGCSVCARTFHNDSLLSGGVCRFCRTGGVNNAA